MRAELQLLVLGIVCLLFGLSGSGPGWFAPCRRAPQGWVEPSHVPIIAVTAVVVWRLRAGSYRGRRSKRAVRRDSEDAEL